MKRFLIITTLACLTGLMLVVVWSRSLSAAAITLDVAGEERSYLLHVPVGRDPNMPTPLVLVFHGGGGNADSMVRMSGMNELANKEGFLVAYPNGTGRFRRILTWNGGECCGPAVENGVDDAAFVDALLDELIEQHNVDQNRIYATGISNGGIMSYHLADRLSHRIAAIASVAGTMEAETCQPSRPVPIMHFHGTNDEFLPLEGGYGKNRRHDFRSVEHSLNAWIAANGCEETPTVEALPDVAEDACTVERLTYPTMQTDDPAAEVVFIKITGGGHTWPGAASSPRMLGTLCNDINANEMMWEFFQQHSLEN